ncbi:hypothetical protein As57867_003324, partial [Aphanomyces stellatus]
MTNNTPDQVAYAPAPATPIEADDVATPRQRSPRLRLGVALFAVCGAVCLGIGAYFVTTAASQHHAAKSVITNLQQAPAIRVQLTSFRSSIQINGHMTTTMYLVSRTDATTKDLTFDAIVSQPGPDATHT